MSNLNHKTDYYLMNNYEDNFHNNEWSDDVLSFDDNVVINDDYNNEYGYNKKYSFPEKKGFTFKQNKYK